MCHKAKKIHSAYSPIISLNLFLCDNVLPTQLFFMHDCRTPDEIIFEFLSEEILKKCYLHSTERQIRHNIFFPLPTCNFLLDFDSSTRTMKKFAKNIWQSHSRRFVCVYFSLLRCPESKRAPSFREEVKFYEPKWIFRRSPQHLANSQTFNYFS